MTQTFDVDRDAESVGETEDLRVFAGAITRDRPHARCGVGSGAVVCIIAPRQYPPQVVATAMKKREDYAARLKELVNQLAEDGTVVDDDSDLVDDVGLSSIEIMELIEQLEDMYDISFPLNDLAEIRTITDMAKELERLVAKQ